MEFQHKIKMRIGKRGNLMYEVIMHLILVALLFALFFYATAGRVGTKDVKQQVLEKQIALMIDSAESGMSFSIYKINSNGRVDNIELSDGKVHALVEGQKVSKGYPYFSKYNVGVRFVDNDKELEDKFVVSVG
tara:strand:+ start:2676 stop:3074 length:399 start_codon:yes stop_codon:yes gene_type:complete